MDYVKSGVGLGFFGQRDLSMGPNPKRQTCVSFLKTKRKPRSLERLIGLLAFVVWKLWPENRKYVIQPFGIN